MPIEIWEGDLYGKKQFGRHETKRIRVKNSLKLP